MRTGLTSLTPLSMLHLFCFAWSLLGCFTNAFCPHRSHLSLCIQFSSSNANIATRAKLSHWVLVLAGFLHSHVFFDNVLGALALPFLPCLIVRYMYGSESLEISKVPL